MNDGIDRIAAGVYSDAGYIGAWSGGQSRLAMNSDRIWCQGPRGGVKMVKDRINYPGGMYGYITNNNKAMKEYFLLIKGYFNICIALHLHSFTLA